MSSSSSSLSIDDIWNSLANDEISNIEELHRKKATLQREKKKIKTSINSKVINNKDHLELMMHDLLLGQLSEKPKTIKSKNKSNNKQSGMLDVSMNIVEKDIVNITKKVQSSKDININNNCKNNDSNNDNNNSFIQKPFTVAPANNSSSSLNSLFGGNYPDYIDFDSFFKGKNNIYIM